MGKLECYNICPIKYADGNRPCAYGVVMQPTGTACRENIKKAFAPEVVTDMQPVIETVHELTVEGTDGQIGRVVSGYAIKTQS